MRGPLALMPLSQVSAEISMILLDHQRTAAAATAAVISSKQWAKLVIQDPL